MTEKLSPGRALSVRVSVCLYGFLEAAVFDRFLLNLNYIVNTKIWDDTFLRFLKFYSNDVITAFLQFLVGPLSRLSAIFFKLTHFDLQLNTLGLQTSSFG